MIKRLSTEVLDNIRSDKAIQAGDVSRIITLVDGSPAKDPDSMRTLIVALAPGKVATLKLKRRQENIELQVKVGKRPEAKRALE